MVIFDGITFPHMIDLHLPLDGIFFYSEAYVVK